MSEPVDPLKIAKLAVLVRQASRSFAALLDVLDAFDLATGHPKKGLEPTAERWEAARALAVAARGLAESFQRSHRALHRLPGVDVPREGEKPPRASQAFDRVVAVAREAAGGDPAVEEKLAAFERSAEKLQARVAELRSRFKR